MNLVGEVHAHGQLDEQVDAETVAALRDDGLTWTHTEPFNQFLVEIICSEQQSLSQGGSGGGLTEWTGSV